MNHTMYRCDGIDRESGKPRTEVIGARSSEDAIQAANRVGLMVEDVTEVPCTRKQGRGAYEVVFAIGKTLAMLLAFVVLFGGYTASDTVFQQILAVTLGCFFLIVTRIFQAEEHSRGVVRRMNPTSPVDNSPWPS